MEKMTLGEFKRRYGGGAVSKMLENTHIQDGEAVSKMLEKHAHSRWGAVSKMLSKTCTFKRGSR